MLNRRNFLLAAASVSVVAPALGCKATSAEAAPGQRTPVIVELFTSEGCSSCPPADSLLQQLHETQPVAGAEILPLEIHVDYWNDLGWRDPFSDARFSERQRRYDKVRTGSSAFTPEAVVGGKRSVLGSSRSHLMAAIDANRSEVTTRLGIKRVDDEVEIQVGELAPGASGDLELWLAVTESALRTKISRGENAGRTVEHAPVVRKLSKLGEASKGSVKTTIQPHPDWERANLSVVVFVQAAKSRQIHGAALTRFALA